MTTCAHENRIATVRFRTRLFLFLGLTLAAAGVALAMPRLAQPQWYHAFADQRPLLGIPHALNVLSNLPFVLVGVAGLVFVVRCPATPQGPFVRTTERWPLVVLFAGITLTGFGSAYYHADPNNARLLWDRLPLAVAFMALFAIILSERLNLKNSALLVIALVLLGGGSVLYWHLSEAQGTGDLRPYLFVQLYPLVAVPLLLLLFPPRYTHTVDLWAALLCYVLAKALELLDAPIYAQGQLVSGHTLKHLVAGLCAAWILVWARTRRLILPLRSV